MPVLGGRWVHSAYLSIHQFYLSLSLLSCRHGQGFPWITNLLVHLTILIYDSMLYYFTVILKRYMKNWHKKMWQLTQFLKMVDLAISARSESKSAHEWQRKQWSRDLFIFNVNQNRSQSLLHFAFCEYLPLRTQAGLGADCKLFCVKLMRAGGQPVLQIITTLMMDPAPQGISLRGYGKRSETQVMEYVCCVPKTLF